MVSIALFAKQLELLLQVINTSKRLLFCMENLTDFAVGAPFEGNFGAVYIYFGQRQNENLHFVRIPGESPAHLKSGVALDSFGQAINGDVDLDGNGTPGELRKQFQNTAFVIFVPAKPHFGILCRFHCRKPSQSIGCHLPNQAETFHARFLDIFPSQFK